MKENANCAHCGMHSEALEQLASLKETLTRERKEFFEELEKLRNELAVARKALHQIHLIAAAEC